ncbi:MAG TPA: GTPase Era [Acidimicrobiia bacterium]|nr:GTPase Era [Acidimicrobiia bacterium]
MIDENTQDGITDFRCGIVSVVGRPNVGKSTLVNALVEKDLSITSGHAGTTRRQIRAIDNGENYQIIYVDTPGIHKPRGGLSERMNESAYDALSGVDIVIGVFDASADIGKGDTFIAEKIKAHRNVFLVLNKCDVEKSFERVAMRAQQISELVPDARHVFITSAFTHKNVHLIRRAIIEQLEVGPALFDRDAEHDMSDDFLVAELYREALLRLVRDELPQGIAVIAREDRDSTKDDKRFFDLKVIVITKSHKPIVIGKGGSMLETAGSVARSRAEALLGYHIVMRTRVEVDEKWQSRTENLDTYLL